MQKKEKLIDQLIGPFIGLIVRKILFNEKNAC